VAARQYGHITRAQLLGLEVSEYTVNYWLTNGRLVRVHAGVYALGHPERSPLALAAAAVLACGEGAALSHASAAALWDLGPWPSRPEVTCPQRRRPGIRTHRSTTLTRAEIARRHNIPVTGIVRTILDVAPRLTDAQLTRTINDARIAGHLTPSRHTRLKEKSARIDKLTGGGGAPTRSHLEDRFRRFCAQHRLPTPQLNARVAGFEVDALFAAEKVIVELDGWAFHNSRKSFEADRRRDLVTSSAGYLTVRITWGALTTQTADRLQAILESRSDPVGEDHS
jgi:very-short-patch-repair endonuclease